MVKLLCVLVINVCAVCTVYVRFHLFDRLTICSLCIVIVPIFHFAATKCRKVKTADFINVLIFRSSHH